MHWPVVFQHAFAFERAPPTPYTLLTAVFGFYAMAVLVQLPRTNVYRAALLPVVLWMTLRANMSLNFSWNDPTNAILNKGLTLGMITVAMRTTVLACAQNVYARLSSCDDTVNGGQRESVFVKHTPTVSAAMWNAFDLISNPRGIGWTGPQKMYIPEPYFRIESRLAFFFLSLCRTLLLLLAFEAAGRYLRSLGPDTFGTSKGGTIFDPSLPLLERYARSSMIGTISAFGAYFLIDAVYHLNATVFTLLFRQHPSHWPPFFDSPWLSTSLTSFWGRRWHQVFHDCFVTLGGKPLERYFGRTGLVMGAFAASGVLHDISMRAMGRGTDAVPIMGFFLLHGVCMMLEYGWGKVTGHRVGGPFGFLWTSLVLVSTGQVFVEVWARNGLLATRVCPDAYSPSGLFLDWMSR